jgi:peptidoglycan/LPS O-acetylase OafA/YrhL
VRRSHGSELQDRGCVLKQLDYELAPGSSIVLDLIRSASSQLVVVGHGIAFFGVLAFFREPSFPWMQNIAVLVFFLLSGFLIPYSVARRTSGPNDYSFSQFFVDRFARIFVPFLVAIGFVLCLDLLSKALSPDTYKYDETFNAKTLVGNILMLQDFPISVEFDIGGVESFASARPFWTLAVEWWIYMLFGFITLVVFKADIRWLTKAIWGVALSIVPIYNLVGGRGNGLTAVWLLGTVVFILLATDVLQGVSTVTKTFFAVVTCALGLTRAYDQMEAYDLVFAFLLATSMWLVIDLTKGVEFNKVSRYVISLTAGYAYTLYLVHYSILDFVQVHAPRWGLSNRWALFLIAFATSNVVAFGIAHFAEGAMTDRVRVAMRSRLAHTAN